jgi:cytoskeletal protein RodZ
MQSLIPSWSLNEGETYTVLVFFFLITFALLVGLVFFILWYCGPKSTANKTDEEGEDDQSSSVSAPSSSGTSNGGEDKPLLQPSKSAVLLSRKA